MPFTFWKKYSQIDLLEAVVGPIVDGTDGAYFVKAQIYEQILRTQSRTLEMKRYHSTQVLHTWNMQI